MEAVECIKNKNEYQGFRHGPVLKNILTEIITTRHSGVLHIKTASHGGCDCIRKKKEELSGLLVRLLEEGKHLSLTFPKQCHGLQA